MADVVEQILEKSLSSLQDLVARRLLSSAEVKSLVETRRQFEYKLQRRAARKADYLKYVEYELKVDALRRLRKQRLGLKKSTVSDAAQVQHVFFIFERAVRKFQGDADMWMQYIDFTVQQKSEKRLGKLFARALQLHPRNAAMWVRAASWQFFGMSNATAARVLMQRAIRINSKTKTLWHEYFRLEFHYVLKLLGRREVLGLEIPQGDGAAAGATEERGDGAAGFYEGAVPRAVFENAIKQVPDDLEFRIGFLKICDEFDGAHHVAQRVLDSLVEDFRDEPVAWRTRALYPLAAGRTEATGGGGGGGRSAKRQRREAGADSGAWTEADEAAATVFEQAVLELPANPAIWRFYADFVHSAPAPSTGSHARLEALYERATSAGAISAEMLLHWAGLAAAGASGAASARAVLRRGVELRPADARLWLRLVELVHQEGVLCGAASGGDSVQAVVDEALDAIPSGSVGPVLARLWQPVLEQRVLAALHEAGGGSVRETTHALFMRVVELGAVPDSTVCGQYLAWAVLVDGSKGAASVFHRVMGLVKGGTRALVPFILEFIKIESSQPHPDLALVRQAYEAALRDAHDEDAGAIFDAYAQFEEDRGDSAKAGAIKWRAKNI